MSELGETLQRVRRLESEVAVAKTTHDKAQVEYDELCAKFQAEYGTSDIGELEKKLHVLEAELSESVEQAAGILAEIPEA